jgi:hypothetical protein
MLSLELSNPFLDTALHINHNIAIEFSGSKAKQNIESGLDVAISNHLLDYVPRF